MRAMAAPATRSELGALGNFFPMKTAIINFGHVIMTIAAIDRLYILFMGKFRAGKVFMTGDAFQFAMN